MHGVLRLCARCAELRRSGTPPSPEMVQEAAEHRAARLARVWGMQPSVNRWVFAQQCAKTHEATQELLAAASALTSLAAEPPGEHDALQEAALCEKASTEAVAALGRLSEAIRSDDVTALRALYAGNGGFVMGTVSSLGSSEHAALRAALSCETLPSAALKVFFGELGGRFLVAPQYHMCVYTLLIQLDQQFASIKRPSEADTARWVANMADIVRLLVDELGMPVALRHCYAHHPLFQDSPSLMELAWSVGAWSAWAAFAQYLPRAASAAQLLRHILDPSSHDGYSQYWVRRLAACVDEPTLWQFAQHPQWASDEHQAVLEAEGARRRDRREAMRAHLFRLRHEHGVAHDVLCDPFLGRMIHDEAFLGDARFFRPVPENEHH